MNQTERLNKKPKYWAMSVAAVLVTAFVLVQPTIQTSYAQVSIEGVPPYGDCVIFGHDFAEDPMSMNTIRVQDIAKTVIVEKEIFRCFTEQGNIALIVDVTTVGEILENMTSKTIIAKQANVVTCAKLAAAVPDWEDFAGDGSVLGCDVYKPKTDVVPVSKCFDITPFVLEHPQETNTVNKGKTVKTIIAQKELFICTFESIPAWNPLEGYGVFWADDNDKKIEQYIIEEIWEDLRLAPSDTIVQQNVESLRCTTLIIDAFVESCQFKSVPVQELVLEE